MKAIVLVAIVAMLAVANAAGPNAADIADCTQIIKDFGKKAKESFVSVPTKSVAALFKGFWSKDKQEPAPEPVATAKDPHAGSLKELRKAHDYRVIIQRPKNGCQIILEIKHAEMCPQIGDFSEILKSGETFKGKITPEMENHEGMKMSTEFLLHAMKNIQDVCHPPAKKMMLSERILRRLVSLIKA